MPNIVVSYRRSDSDAIAGRIRDRLVAHYGADSIFMDIDSIPFGSDFRQHISTAIAQYDLLLAIIGPTWTGVRPGNETRILQETDPVRIEIEAALKRGIPVVPVLVNRATMPAASELPETLQEFSFRNAAEVESGRDFHQHMDRLIRAIDQGLKTTGAVLPPAKATKNFWTNRALVPSTAAIAVVAIAAGTWMFLRSPMPSGPVEESWSGKEGGCEDWDTAWSVSEGPPGVWKGKIEFQQVGGNCQRPTGLKLRANITAMERSGIFLAARTGSSDGNDCNYSGIQKDRKVTGTYFCRNGGPYIFTLNR